MKKHILDIEKDSEGMRLDRFIRNKYNLAQSIIEKNIRKKFIKLNDQKTVSNARLRTGDKVEIDESLTVLGKETTKPKLPNLDLNRFKNMIIFENDNLFIVDKPYGLATQGGIKINVSLDDYLKQYNNQNNTDYKITHRLDKHTTGCIIIAKHRQAAEIIGKKFKQKEIKKIYYAICQNKPNLLKNKIILDNEEEGIMETYYEVIEYNKIHNLSLIKFMPINGKKHQIRVTASHLNSPILGDKRYNELGQNTLGVENKMMLCCLEKEFEYEGEKIHVKAKLPEHFKNMSNFFDVIGQL